jgi:predicted nucleic acid-binding protein
MKSYVVDASVAVKWFVPELYREAALRLWTPECCLQGAKPFSTGSW